MTEAYRRGFMAKCAECMVSPGAAVLMLKTAETVYRARSGDSLHRIAMANGTTVDAIASLNGIRDPSRILPGQSIRIPSAVPTQRTVPPAARRPAAGNPVRADLSRYSGRDDAVSRVIDFIKEREGGFRDKAYYDEAGKLWTIGYGQTHINGRPVVEGDVISEPEALKFTTDRLGSGYNWLVDNIPRFLEMSPAAQSLLMDLRYNLKENVLTPAVSKNLHAHLLDGKAYPNPDDVVFEEYPTYNKAGGVVNEGLVNRRRMGLETFMPERLASGGAK